MNIISSTFHDSAVANTFEENSQANFNCTFNPFDKIVELYEALLKSEREKIEMLQKMLEK